MCSSDLEVTVKSVKKYNELMQKLLDDDQVNITRNDTIINAPKTVLVAQ